MTITKNKPFYIFSMILTITITVLSLLLAIQSPSQEGFFVGIIGMPIGVISFISALQTYKGILKGEL